jgi:ribosomal protein S18 acetylase RimI-like enzyme
VSDLRPASPATRPATARPRSDAPPEVEPPSPEEVARIARHLASQAEHDGAEVRDDAQLGVLLSYRAATGPEHNYAARPCWGGDEWADRLALVRAHMLASGKWPSILLSPELDQPAGRASTEAILRLGGWAPVMSERTLWVGHASVVPHLDPSLRIEAVQPHVPASIADHEALERLAFGIAPERAADRRDRLAEALASGRLRAWIVRVDGEPVAVARLSQGDGVAGLTGIAVHPDRRRRGLGTLTTIVATRAGLALGNRIVWLSVRDGDEVASNLYAKLGFRPVFGWTRWLAVDPPAR